MKTQVLAVRLAAHARRLAASPQPAEAELDCPTAELQQPRPIVVDPVVLIVPSQLAVKLRPDFPRSPRRARVAGISLVVLLA